MYATTPSTFLPNSRNSRKHLTFFSFETPKILIILKSELTGTCIRLSYGNSAKIKAHSITLIRYTRNGPVLTSSRRYLNSANTHPKKTSQHYHIAPHLEKKKQQQVLKSSQPKSNVGCKGKSETTNSPPSACLALPCFASG